MNEIKFVSPVNEGETFTLTQLFDVTENQKAFEEYSNEEVNKKLKSKLAIEREEINNELSARFEEKTSIIKSQARVDVQEITSKLNAEIETIKGKANNAVEEARSKATAVIDQERNRISKESQEKEAILNAQIKSLQNNMESQIRELTKRANEQVTDLKKDKETINEQLTNISLIMRKQFEERVQEINSIHTEQIAKLREEVENAKSATSTIGNSAEEDVRDTLRTLFPSDTIRRPNHATGEADVDQTIIHEGKDIAKVYYEVKNRKNWSRSDYENFADKVRKESHDYNIYIGKALPKKAPETFIKMINSDLFYDEINNVYITSFENWKAVIFAIRTLALQFVNKIDAQSRMEDIKDKVYGFVKGPDFANYFSRITKVLDKLEKIFKEIQRQSAQGIGETATIVGEIDSLQSQIKALL